MESYTSFYILWPRQSSWVCCIFAPITWQQLLATILSQPISPNISLPDWMEFHLTILLVLVSRAGEKLIQLDPNNVWYFQVSPVNISMSEILSSWATVKLHAKIQLTLRTSQTFPNMRSPRISFSVGAVQMSNTSKFDWAYLSVVSYSINTSYT